MATSTTNLGLIKPAGTDKIRIAQINSNMDVIDTKMGAVGSISLQEQIGNFLHSGNTTRGKNIDDLRPKDGGIFYFNGYGTSDMSGTFPFTDSFGILYCGDNGYGGYMQTMLKILTGEVYRRTYQNNTWNSWAQTNVAQGNTIAIVATGSTAPQAITSGQYVIWNGALYTATTNIASGATLSASNLTPVSGGGLNALHDQLKMSSFKQVVLYNENANGFSVTFPSNSCTVIYYDQFSRIVYIRATSSEVSYANIIGDITPIVDGRTVKLPVGGWNLGTFLVSSAGNNVAAINITVY